MGCPEISICLPNLNNCLYLTERIDSIFAQTGVDWELIVVDGFSDDGSWELLKDRFAGDSRTTLSQEPRCGIYAAINSCVARAKGDYVYVATSDDTMRPTCLSEMLRALKQNAECGLAHCCLEYIDDKGGTISPNPWLSSAAVKYFGELIKTTHIRRAPLDGLLHFYLWSVYQSLTQLLIRRSVFKTIGSFRQDIGVEADFEWNMRASLMFDTVHVPKFLATWRCHPKQATGGTWNVMGRRHLQKMCKIAIAYASRSDVEATVSLVQLLDVYATEEEFLRIHEAGPRWRKMLKVCQLAFVKPRRLLRLLCERAKGQPSLNSWAVKRAQIDLGAVLKVDEGQTPTMIISRIY